MAAIAGFAVHVSGQAPSAPTGVQVLVAQTTGSVGPMPNVTCPADAVSVEPGASIQSLVNANPGTTVFCIKAGVHPITSAITPKTGNTFVGESGAILDGSGWATTDTSQAAFRANNQDIDDVTIRNLVIRNMPQKGIHAYNGPDRWLIERCDIGPNAGTGVAAPRHSTVRYNHIHHNTVGGYSAYQAVNITFESNEIAYNGSEQKLVATTNGVFRNNWVHHNAVDGIWFDAENIDGLIEGNLVEDHPRESIFYEISGKGIIRNNIVRRGGGNAIFVSTSKDVEIYGNTLEYNFRGIQYYLNCNAVGAGIIKYDLANNVAYNNSIRVGTQSGVLANMLSHWSGCSSTAVEPYVNGSKNNLFRDNTYFVPSSSTKYWVWGFSQLKSWSEWRALGQDTTSGSALKLE
jgi:hypothetical protein